MPLNMQKKRLGGDIYDEDLKLMDEKEIEDEVLQVVNKMKELGLNPGGIFAEELF